MNTGKEALTISNGELRFVGVEMTRLISISGFWIFNQRLLTSSPTNPFRRSGIREKVPSKFRPRQLWLWSARTCPRFGSTRHVASRKAATCCRTPKAMSCHRTPRQLPQLSHGASATPLAHARKSSASSLFPVRAKAPSPLPFCRRTAKSPVRKAVFDGFLKFRPFLPVFPACNVTVLACTAFELGCMAMMQTREFRCNTMASRHTFSGLTAGGELHD